MPDAVLSEEMKQQQRRREEGGNKKVESRLSRGSRGVGGKKECAKLSYGEEKQGRTYGEEEQGGDSEEEQGEGKILRGRAGKGGKIK